MSVAQGDTITFWSFPFHSVYKIQNRYIQGFLAGYSLGWNLHRGGGGQTLHFFTAVGINVIGYFSLRDTLFSC